MAPLWQHYLQPASLGDALQALSSAPGPACPIAGGSDLLLDIRQGHISPVNTLVDVSAIPELTALEERGAELLIGAAVPVCQIIQSPLVLRHAQALAEACDLIGGPQVRNVATLGGNVAHALPAADGAIALLALDAYAVVASLEPKPGAETPITNSLVVGALAPQNPGKSILDLPELQNTHICLKKVPLLDLYLGPGRTALKTGQLLVHFTLPLAESGQGSSFQRVMRLQGVALPVLNLAVWLRREGEIITDLRIMVGPAGPTPQRALAAEHALRGRRLTPESLADAQAALLTETHFRTSPRRATADYRRHLTGILLQDALSVAWKRAA